MFANVAGGTETAADAPETVADEFTVVVGEVEQNGPGRGEQVPDAHGASCDWERLVPALPTVLTFGPTLF